MKRPRLPLPHKVCLNIHLGVEQLNNSSVFHAEFLTVTFTENTPAIDGDTVAVKLATNRPVLKMVCQLLNHSPKKKKIDCKFQKF